MALKEPTKEDTVNDRKYRVGERAKGLYLGKGGTTLANGTVTAVEQRADGVLCGYFDVTVELDNGRTETYLVSRAGNCDALDHGEIHSPEYQDWRN